MRCNFSQVKAFFESGEDCLWITFTDGHLVEMIRDLGPADFEALTDLIFTRPWSALDHPRSRASLAKKRLGRDVVEVLTKCRAQNLSTRATSAALHIAGDGYEIIFVTPRFSGDPSPMLNVLWIHPNLEPLTPHQRGKIPFLVDRSCTMAKCDDALGYFLVRSWCASGFLMVHNALNQSQQIPVRVLREPFCGPSPVALRRL